MRKKAKLSLEPTIFPSQTHQWQASPERKKMHLTTKISVFPSDREFRNKPNDRSEERSVKTTKRTKLKEPGNKNSKELRSKLSYVREKKE